MSWHLYTGRAILGVGSPPPGEDERLEDLQGQHLGVWVFDITLGIVTHATNLDEHLDVSGARLAIAALWADGVLTASGPRVLAGYYDLSRVPLLGGDVHSQLAAEMRAALHRITQGKGGGPLGVLKNKRGNDAQFFPPVPTQIDIRLEARENNLHRPALDNHPPQPHTHDVYIVAKVGEPLEDGPSIGTLRLLPRWEGGLHSRRIRLARQPQHALREGSADADASGSIWRDTRFQGAEVALHRGEMNSFTWNWADEEWLTQHGHPPPD